MDHVRTLHDFLQSANGDFDRPCAGEPGKRLEGLLRGQNVDEAAGVDRAIARERRQHLFVAAAFAVAVDLAIHPPDGRVEPPDRLSHKLQSGDPHITALTWINSWARSASSRAPDSVSASFRGR